MIFIYGTRVYGRVDRVPGFFHVVTRFDHLWYLPLIPRGSFLIQENLGKEFGLPLPLSFKSILMSWVRVAVFLLNIVAVCIAIAIWDLSSEQRAVAVTLVVGAVALFWLVSYSPWFIRASYRRACQLRELAGLPEAVQDEIDELYGYEEVEDDEDEVPDSGFSTV